MITTQPVKPCPFCGDSDPYIDEIRPGLWALTCNGCGTVGPHDTAEERQNPEQAQERWNERAVASEVLL